MDTELLKSERKSPGRWVESVAPTLVLLRWFALPSAGQSVLVLMARLTEEISCPLSTPSLAELYKYLISVALKFRLSCQNHPEGFVKTQVPVPIPRFVDCAGLWWGPSFCTCQSHWAGVTLSDHCSVCEWTLIPEEPMCSDTTVLNGRAPHSVILSCPIHGFSEKIIV